MRFQKNVGYLCWLAGTVITLAVLCVGFTMAVDPYRMHGTPPVLGWTALKPRVYEQNQLARAYQIERVAPVTVLFGSSRVAIGLDPDSPSWPASSRPVFNAGLAGTGLETVAAMLRHTISVRTPSAVVIGLEYQDFAKAPVAPGTRPAAPGADELRLRVGRDGKPNPARAQQIWRDRITTTLTLDALGDSIATMLRQDANTGATMTELGFDPRRDYIPLAAQAGFGALFAHKNTDYNRQFRRAPVVAFDDVSQNPGFVELSGILASAKAHGIAVSLFIQPHHADLQDILYQTGHWDAFEAWKRALVEVAEVAQARLFDFSGYDVFTTETVPPRGDKSPMRWYWESGHYTRELGEHLLFVMLHEGPATQSLLLTKETVGTRQAAIREAREAYWVRTGVQPSMARWAKQHPAASGPVP